MKLNIFPIIGITLMAIGCTSRDILPVSIEGIVELDGKPMPEGTIEFSQPGYPPSQIQITDGKFQGMAMQGSNTVKFARWVPNQWDPGIPETMKKGNDPGKRNILPEKFGNSSKMTADVKANSKFTFQVTSK
jgi:hypothetical protein